MTGESAGARSAAEDVGSARTGAGAGGAIKFFAPQRGQVISLPTGASVDKNG